MRIKLAAFFIAPALIQAQMAFAQNSQPSWNQKLGMFSKPSVVRIGAGCFGKYKYNNKYYSFTDGAVGSGYFVNPNGYIVTNAHVVEAVKDGKDKCKEGISNKLAEKIKADYPKVDEKNIQRQIYKKVENDGDFQFYNYVLLANSEEPFPFETKQLGIAGGNQDVTIIKIETKNAPVLKLGDSDKVQLLDDVLVIGYPTAADLGFELKTQSIFEASVNEGKISNKNKKLQNNASVLQLDAQAAGGSSGSPVLNNQGEVVGMITLAGTDKDKGAFVPFAIPTGAIQESIRRSGTVNEQGVIDRLYREGLELYWKQDYKGAKTKFEAVKGLFPQHSEIDQLIRDSEQKIADNWDKTDYTPWLVAIGGFLAGTTAVLLFVNLRKQSRSNAAASTEYAEYPTPDAVEEPRIEQEVESPSLQVITPSRVSHMYRPATLMSLQTTYVELKNPQGVMLKLNLQGDSYRIGRDRDWSDIDLTGSGWNVISWHHAVLNKEGENYRIYDGDGTKLSTNRIWIDDRPIDSREGHLLKDGDQLKIGLDPENQVILTYSNPANKESVA
ncbi:hypothetical protein A6770_25995 [Nostoc minutum NIES-26]|uniref:FHA domain-containing protein n=1 Tax=Nostoc minutum NIES-26 TaxID=1844469 RepID=A0A367QV92_9NOSO|nr:hypothetical protein A6770_25995 [Nostoc minutum NIES-26]